MLKHIVMIKLRESYSEEEKKGNAEKFRQMLIDLLDKIPELKGMEVGMNISDKPSAYDLVLTSVFENEDGLNTYRIHPEHLKVVDFMKLIMEKVAVVDYIE